MKKLLLGTLFGLAVLASPSFAADLSYPVKAPRIAPAPVFSWTGFYVGVNGGGGWGEFDTWSNKFTDVGDPMGSDSWTQTAGGFMAGGQAGYNYQFNNNFVLGIEADIAWSSIKAKESGRFDGAESYSYGTEVEWFGAIRGRLGYAWDSVLLYGTGGAAFGKVNMFDNNYTLDDNFSVNDVLWGWTAGAGFEWAFARNWTVKAEYLYIDLGSISADPFIVRDNGNFWVQSTDVKFHTLKVGLNYRF